jgi:hypothetical protein
MVDLVSQAGFARRPAHAFEAGIDVEERQVAGKCRMHDRFLLVVRRYGR